MNPDRWRIIKEIVAEALELPLAEREAFVAGRCAGDEDLRAEVSALLAHEAHAGSFLQPVSSDAVAAAAAGAMEDSVRESDLIGRRIGRYRIMRRIAVGGMGAVFEAEQDTPRRSVALKIIQRGMISPSVLRRFEYEAQLLGRLNHPGIARIYEAGTYDLGDGARPFFAMELIDGLSLLEFARQRELPIRRRIELMIRVCDAVQHAHQRGVIHRDLKPANILVAYDAPLPSEPRAEASDPPVRAASGNERLAFAVEETAPSRSRLRSETSSTPQPKILDFGVARAIDADAQFTTMHTLAGELVGTVRYMSPEQVAGDPDDIDTRCDVYALGVICYELLSGRMPYDFKSGTVVEVSRAIAQDDPIPLSAVDRSLRGDIDTVLRTALAKDKSRRYASVAEFGADLQRCLRHEPIAARPPSALDRMMKFTRRHRALVGGVAATFIVLVAGLVVTIVQSRRIEREARNTQYEADKYRAVHDFIVNDFLWKLLAAVGSASEDKATIVSLIDAAEADVAKLFGDQPLHEAAVRNQIATMYYNAGLYAKSEAQFARSLDIGLEHLGPDHRDTLNYTNNTALAKMRQGDLEGAEPLYRAAYEGRRRVLGEEHSDTLVSMNNLAPLLRQRGDLAGAEQLLRRAVEVQSRVRGEQHSDTLTSMSNLADVLAARGDLAGAETLHRQAVYGLRLTLCGKHVTTLFATTRLASTLRARRNLAEALPLSRAAMAGLQSTLGPAHSHTLAAMIGLGELLTATGEFDEAQALLTSALAESSTALGESHHLTRAAQTRLDELAAARSAVSDAPVIADNEPAAAEAPLNSNE